MCACSVVSCLYYKLGIRVRFAGIHTVMHTVRVVAPGRVITVRVVASGRVAAAERARYRVRARYRTTRLRYRLSCAAALMYGSRGGCVIVCPSVRYLSAQAALFIARGCVNVVGGCVIVPLGVRYRSALGVL